MVVIVFAVIFFSNPVSLQNAAGTAIALGGVFAYSQVGRLTSSLFLQLPSTLQSLCALSQLPLNQTNVVYVHPLHVHTLHQCMDLGPPYNYVLR